MRVLEPLRVANVEGRYDVVAKLHGGGVNGQADALRLGIARSLADMDPSLRHDLKRAGLLTRDARVVETQEVRSPQGSAGAAVHQALGECCSTDPAGLAHRPATCWELPRPSR